MKKYLRFLYGVDIVSIMDINNIITLMHSESSRTLLINNILDPIVITGVDTSVYNELFRFMKNETKTVCTFHLEINEDTGVANFLYFEKE